jgi:hypothetical protein
MEVRDMHRNDQFWIRLSNFDSVSNGKLAKDLSTIITKTNNSNLPTFAPIEKSRLQMDGM